jgi:FMN phosphatase YigB (HAD superfamily)
MIEAVIFDLGGVLAYDVWEHLLLDETEGVASLWKLDRQQVERLGRALWEEFSIRPTAENYGWRELEREYWTEFAERLGLSIPIDEFISLTDKFIRPVQGMVQLLEELQRENLELAVCSDNTEFWFERQMTKLGLYRFFRPQNIVLSSRVGVTKSSADSKMFQAVVGALGSHKHNCIFVDDRTVPVFHSIEFGLGTILFPSHAQYGARYLRLLLERMRGAPAGCEFPGGGNARGRT